MQTATSVLDLHTQSLSERRPMDNTAEIDLSIFGTREIRNILKNKAHCLKAGFSPDHPIISTFDEILNAYTERVGLATYLSQMLGDLANVPVQNCTFSDEKGQPIIAYLNGNGQQPVQKFIAQHFGLKNLPFRVDARRQPDSDQAETRYL